MLVKCTYSNKIVPDINCILNIKKINMYVIQRDEEIFSYYKTLRIFKKRRKLLVKILKNLQTEFYIKIVKI